MPETLVLGAGVVGMATAWCLARRGHAVTVIDAGAAPAEAGASYGNGAQLSYAYTDALASPAVVRQLPRYLLGLDPAFRFRPSLSLGFLAWSTAFLANATRGRFERNTLDVLKLAMESREGFAAIKDTLDFDHAGTGKLILYATPEAAHHAEALSRLKNAHGAQQTMLTPQQAIDREPALAAYGYPFAAALWSPLDEAGDSRRFCLALQHLLQTEYGVRFRLDTRVTALKQRGGRLVAVQTSQGELPCTRAVIALGVGSAEVARTVGIRLPIWPMQGYSITVPATASAPRASITDTARKVVFCRIGHRLRIAGLADLGPRHGRFSQQRFDILMTVARGIFPEAGDYAADPHPWTGLRPMTPDSRPIVGASKIAGVYLNCGHGALGWTLCMGTAARLADAMDA